MLDRGLQFLVLRRVAVVSVVPVDLGRVFWERPVCLHASTALQADGRLPRGLHPSQRAQTVMKARGRSLRVLYRQARVFFVKQAPGLLSRVRAQTLIV